MGSVYIPVQGTEEEVKVVLDQLPRDASDILDILKAEQAPLHLWLVIAREYFKQGKTEQFLQILTEGSSPEIDEYYADVKYERIAILNALGAYYTFLGKIDVTKREQNFQTATQYYNRASRIDETEPSTWIGKGQLCIAKNELQMAFDSFKIVLQESPDNVPALLGQAYIHFLNGEKEEQPKKAIDFYKNSLKLYKRALCSFPNGPAAMRLGIGFCNYKLGNMVKARQAFQRVLQLEPENAEALVALATMDLQSNDGFGVKLGMENMKRAFELHPHNSTSLNHLANHFFFTGQHFLVEQLTESALALSDHGPAKSHSYYNLARSYHSKGDFEKAGRYYMASVKEVHKPRDFVLPYYGLGQIQLKFGDLRNALTSFEKVLETFPENCETLKATACIHAQLGDNNKAIETLRKVTRIDAKDQQAYMELGELLMATDVNAAMSAFTSAHNLFKKAGEDSPIELLNSIGVLYFEKGDLKMAEQSFKEALGDGIWDSILNGDLRKVGSCAYLLDYRDASFLEQLKNEGASLELPREKVTTLFNYARLFEELHDTIKASLLYRLIVFKFPDYVDAYLRLAALAKSRNHIQLSIDLVNDALKVDDKCPNALSMLGSLELKNDDWIKAKDRFRAVREASGGKDCFSTIQLGNWNYFAAQRPEKKAPKAEATHLEKAKELYNNVLKDHRSNMYAANGAGILLAERAQFDVSKDIFTQVQEAASGNIFVQMPDVWVNLAHIYFAQGQYPLAVKMYQNCLRKFYYNTDSEILLYQARTHYEAEQWNESKKTLLKAIHLAPSNYTLRFDLCAVLQKFSQSTLTKIKRTADEVRLSIAELKNAMRIFSLLTVAATYHSHGFDERKLETHVEYCKHLMDAAKVYCQAAEKEELQTRNRLEHARQLSIAEEAKRKIEEQRKIQLERRKQEDELKQLMQQEQEFERKKEQWKSSSTAPASRRRDRSKIDDEEGTPGERRRRGGKRRRKDQKTKARNGDDGLDQDDEIENGKASMLRNQEDDMDEKAPEDNLLAAGLEDSDADDDLGGPSSARHRKRRALSESEDDEPQQEPSPRRHKGSYAGSEEES